MTRTVNYDKNVFSNGNLNNLVGNFFFTIITFTFILPWITNSMMNTI